MMELSSEPPTALYRPYNPENKQDASQEHASLKILRPTASLGTQSDSLLEQSTFYETDVLIDSFHAVLSLIGRTTPKA
jgi:hypothetical protein